MVSNIDNLTTKAAGVKQLEILPVKPENIPPELKEYDQWVAWKAVPKANGKIDKVPINPQTGGNASVSDPSTWGSYSRALKFYKNHKMPIAGIGFVLTKDVPFVGGDLDGCREPDTKELTADAIKILNAANTYTEISPSSTGIRFIAHGELPGKGLDKNGIELYDKGRFLTITGRCLEGYPEAIKDRQKEILKLYKERGGNNGNGRNPFGWQDEILDGVDANERHNAAVRLAGRWAMKGLSPKEVENSIIGWNLKNRPPKADLSDPGSIELKNIIHYAFADKFFGDDKSPESIVDALNRKHAVLPIGGKCLILNEGVNPVTKQNSINFSSKADFINILSNQTIPNPNNPQKQISVGNVWWNSKDRRQYAGIVFEPEKDVPDHYNLWRGFAVEPKKGNWSLMKRLIREGICSDNEVLYRYMLAWMARVVQDPGGERPGVCTVLRGGQGVGKGMFVRNFGYLFGPHFLQIAQSSQLVGRFNSHLVNIILLFVDEATWGGDREAEGVVKNLITEPTLTVEAKGKDVFPVRNNMNCLIASNSSWVVPAGKDERRFFAVDVSDKFKGNHTFFKKLAAQMKQGGREAMFHDLLEMDISDVNLKNFERTEALLEQILQSMTVIEKWWFGRLSDGEISDNLSAMDGDSWPPYVSNEVLYDDFKFFASELKKYIPEKEVFGKQLNKLFESADYVRPTINGKRKTCRLLPSLKDCREFFEKTVKMKVDWDHEAEMLKF